MRRTLEPNVTKEGENRSIRSARHNTARRYAERMAAVQSEHQAIFAAIDPARKSRPCFI